LRSQDSQTAENMEEKNGITQVIGMTKQEYN
jgi:hypothetical protein